MKTGYNFTRIIINASNFCSFLDNFVYLRSSKNPHGHLSFNLDTFIEKQIYNKRSPWALKDFLVLKCQISTTVMVFTGIAGYCWHRLFSSFFSSLFFMHCFSSTSGKSQEGTFLYATKSKSMAKSFFAQP